MAKSAASKTFIYLPYVDEHATGMQRFGSEMIQSLLRTGLDAEVLIGELHGRPKWIERVPHRVLVRGALWRRLPRSASALARLLWVQALLPLRAGRRATLLTLADRDLAFFPAVRQIAVVHDLTQVRGLRQLGGRAHDLRIRLWREGLKRSDAVIAISSATKADLIETFGIAADRVYVIHEGFDPTIFFPGAATDANRPYLLYAGTLAPNKNIPFLLRVYAKVRERGANVDLRLVGRYSAEVAADLLASVPAAYRDGVHFAGFITDQQLGEQMRGCAAFVFPSLSEGFGLAPVEAMACGAPTVSSYATSLREVVGDGGVLLSPTDERAWVNTLVRLLADRAFQDELRRRAVRRSAAFSWDRAAQAYAALIAPSWA